jgi:pimeloyl-ACP methyl ester carboxylesterase
MGGMTALEYLGRPPVDRPVEPSGLVLIATAAGKLAERGIGRLISTPATEALFEIVDRAPSFALPTNSLSTAAGFLLGLKRYDQYGALSSITAKTVVVSGGTDFATPVTHADDLTAMIPGAAHTHLPSAGHMLLQETPHQVSAAINFAINGTPWAQDGLATAS